QKLRQRESSFVGLGARALALAVVDDSRNLPNPITDLTSTISGPFAQGAMLTAQLVRDLRSDERADLVREVVKWARAISGESLTEDARALSPAQLADLQVSLGERVAREAAEAPFFISLP